MTLIVIAFENAPRPDAALQRCDAELNAQIKTRFEGTRTVLDSALHLAASEALCNVRLRSTYECYDPMPTAILAAPPQRGTTLDLRAVQEMLRRERWQNLPPGVGFDAKLAYIATLWEQQRGDPFAVSARPPPPRAVSPNQQTPPTNRTGSPQRAPRNSTPSANTRNSMSSSPANQRSSKSAKPDSSQRSSSDSEVFVDAATDQQPAPAETVLPHGLNKLSVGRHSDQQQQQQSSLLPKDRSSHHSNPSRKS